jgi:prefoldin subunit 5
MVKPYLESWPELLAEREEEITELRLEMDRLRARVTELEETLENISAIAKSAGATRKR